MDGSGTILKMTSFKFKTVCQTIVERQTDEGGREGASSFDCLPGARNQSGGHSKHILSEHLPLIKYH